MLAVSVGYQSVLVVSVGVSKCVGGVRVRHTHL